MAYEDRNQPAWHKDRGKARTRAGHKPMVQVSVSLPLATLRKIDRLARAARKNRSAFIAAHLRAHVDEPRS
jgi:hypothetical protein